MKRSLLMFVFLGLLLTGGLVYGSTSSVGISVALNGQGCIPKGAPFVIEISFENDWGNFGGGSWPWAIYSDNGLASVTHVADADSGLSVSGGSDQSIFEFNGWRDYWGLLAMWTGTNWDGALPDTINFTSATISNFWGISSMTKFIGFYLQVDADISGDALCIDSIDHDGTTYDWLFNDPDFQFGGPYCWCVGEPSAVATFNEAVLPTEFKLGQNYPNPFNMSTAIEFAVPKASEITITIFNVLGQKINTVWDKKTDAGYHKAIWDGTAADGSEVSSGMYFYKIETDGFKDTKKLMLLK